MLTQTKANEGYKFSRHDINNFENLKVSFTFDFVIVPTAVFFFIVETLYAVRDLP